MRKNSNDIDRLFLKHLKDHEDDPSENVWSSVENALNRADAKKYKAKYKRIKRLGGLIISLFVFCTAGILLQRTYTVKQTTIKKIPVKNNKTKSYTYLHSLNHKQSEQTKNDVPGYIKKQWTRRVINNMRLLTLSSNKVESQTKKSFEYSLKENLYLSAQPISPPLKENFQLPLYRNTEDSVQNTSFNNQHKQTGKLKSHHGFYIIPFLSYDVPTARVEDEYEYDNEDAADVLKRERSDISFTVGVGGEYQLSNKISLESAISISNLYSSISPTVIRAVPDDNGIYKFKLSTTYGLAEIKKTGIITPQNGDSLTLTNASLGVQYVSIPITVNYAIKQGRFNIESASGIGVNKILNEKMEVNYFDNSNKLETINKIEGLKKSFITFIAGADFNYKINSRMSLGFSPVMRYSLTSVNKNTPVKTYPINFGAAAFIKIRM